MAYPSKKSPSARIGRKRGAIAFFLLLPIFLLACGATDAESGSSGEKVFDPRLPASTFRSEQNYSERDRILQEIWTALTHPQCWDASFIGPATPSFVEVNTARERAFCAAVTARQGPRSRLTVHRTVRSRLTAL